MFHIECVLCSTSVSSSMFVGLMSTILKDVSLIARFHSCFVCIFNIQTKKEKKKIQTKYFQYSSPDCTAELLRVGHWRALYLLHSIRIEYVLYRMCSLQIFDTCRTQMCIILTTQYTYIYVIYIYINICILHTYTRVCVCVCVWYVYIRDIYVNVYYTYIYTRVYVCVCNIILTTQYTY